MGLLFEDETLAAELEAMAAELAGSSGKIRANICGCRVFG